MSSLNTLLYGAYTALWGVNHGYKSTWVTKQNFSNKSRMSQSRICNAVTDSV